MQPSGACPLILWTPRPTRRSRWHHFRPPLQGCALSGRRHLHVWRSRRWWSWRWFLFRRWACLARWHCSSCPDFSFWGHRHAVDVGHGFRSAQARRNRGRLLQRLQLSGRRLPGNFDRGCSALVGRQLDTGLRNRGGFLLAVSSWRWRHENRDRMPGEGPLARPRATDAKRIDPLKTMLVGRSPPAVATPC